MAEGFQQGYLSDGCGGDAIILLGEPDFLDRHFVPAFPVSRLVHHSVGTRADLVQHLEVRHPLVSLQPSEIHFEFIIIPTDQLCLLPMPFGGPF